MENASKALIMAAEVLIAMAILSLATYLIITFGNFSKQVYEQNEEEELQKFNSQFMAYEKMENVNIHDIITVANYAKENNNKYELDSKSRENENTYYVTVKIGNEAIESEEQSKLNNRVKDDMSKIKKDSEKLPTYTCTVEISPATGRVYIVNFK